MKRFWIYIATILLIIAVMIGWMAHSFDKEANLSLLDIKQEPSSHINSLDGIVEENLKMILSSPKTSSDPKDYINAHQDAYENILKQGEDALQYMLSEFKNNNVEGLKAHIMMQASKELLGKRNNVEDEITDPQAWYDALTIRGEKLLPDFEYVGKDPIEKLVYASEIEQNKQADRGFTIVAPKIFGSYKEADYLKVFVTIYSATYKLYDNELELEGGGVIPVAITYKKDAQGNYILEEYQQAMDGSYFPSSIKEFCTMPVSGKKIMGLSNRILNHYGDYEDIIKLQKENLNQHLMKYGIVDVKLGD